MRNQIQCLSLRHGLLWLIVHRLFVAPAFANTTNTWNNAAAGTYSWSAAANWSPSAPSGSTTTTVQFFNDTTTALASGTYTINSDPGTLTLNALNLEGKANASANTTVNIGTAGNSWIFDGTSPTINLDGLNGSKTLTYVINPDLTLSQNLAFTGSGSGAFIFNGNISGAGNIAKSSSGTLWVDGNSMSYAGAISVSAGTLQIGNATTGSASLGTGTITLSGSGSFQIRKSASQTVNNTITGTTTGMVSFQPIGAANIVYTLNKANNYIAPTTLSSGGSTSKTGTLKLGIANGLPTTTSLTIQNATGTTMTFDLGGYNQTLNSLATTAGGSTANSIVTTSSGTPMLTISGTTNTTYAGLISGNLSLVKGNTNSLTLAGANTYTGNTTINGGTLALGVSGSINNTPQIVIGAGGTLDVSAISAFSLGSSTLSASGTTNPATIKGNATGTVNLGSQPIALTYEGTNAPLTISQGQLVLNGNALTVNASPALAAGDYTIITNVGNTISSNGTLTVSGTAISGTVPTILVNAGAIVLHLSVVRNLSTIVYGPTSFTYNGFAQSPIVTFTGSTGARTTNFSGVAPTIYGPSQNAPTNAGIYFMSNTVAADANYRASSNATIFIINPTATVSFSSTNAGLPINPTFCGLSYEKATLTGSLFLSTDTSLINMFGQITPAVLRIGGYTVDTTCWNGLNNLTPITSAQVDALAGFVNALPTNWHVIYGINLVSNTPANCASEAAYVAKALGSRLLAFEIGNEPDVYHNSFRPSTYTYTNFLSEWRTLAAAITNTVPGWAITNSGNGWTLSGPAASYNTSGYTVPFASAEAGIISLLTQHYYRGDGLDTNSTMQLLLQPDPNLTNMASSLFTAATVNHLPLGYRISECGSFFHGGAPDISDAYGSALWTLDTMFSLALWGCQGVNFHGGGQSSGYTPIADNDYTVVEARPEFYGIKLFSLAGQGNVIPATNTISTNFNLTAYGVRQAPGAVSAVLINKETNYSMQVTINLGSNVLAASSLTLTGSALNSTMGYTLGGAPINPDGSWSGDYQSTTITTGGQLVVTVPPITALWLNPVTAGKNATLVSNPGTLAADNASSSTVTLAVKDNSNHGIAGLGVTWTVSGSGNVINPATSGFTDGSGQISFTVASVKSETKAVIINIGAVALTNYITFTNPATPLLFTWDPLHNASGSDGAGVWDVSTTNWANNGSDVAWPNNGSDAAVFGTGATLPSGNTVVTLTTPISVGNLNFNTGGNGVSPQYQLTGQYITLSNLPVITVPASALISSPLTGSGFVKNGAGTLRIEGNATNNFAGNITVSNGVLQLGNNGSSGSLGTGTITVMDPGVFTVRRQGVLNFSNSIAGTFSSTVTFQLNGNAVATLANTSTYNAAGGTILSPTATGTAGTLKLGMNNPLPATTAFVITNIGASVQRLDLAGFNQTFGSLATTAGGSVTNSIITNSVSASTSTLTIAGTNGTTYAGLLAGNVGLVKTGSGTLALTSSNTFAGNTTIAGGTLQISGAVTNSAFVVVTNAATLQLSGGKITAGMVHICTNAFLVGCGTINGVLLNDGTVVSSCGTNITFSGAVTNNGTMRLTAGTQLNAAGPFVNNGLLDLINAAGSLPPGFVNHGVVLDSSSVQVSQVFISGTDVQVQIFSAADHTYQLQRSGSLNPASWGDIGASQSGTGGVLTFTDNSALIQPQGFYRFKVN